MLHIGANPKTLPAILEAIDSTEMSIKNTSTIPTPIPEFNDRDKDGRKLALVYQCRVKWDELQPTEHDQVRYCTNCSQPVFHVLDTKDFVRAVAAKQCVMVQTKERKQLFLGEAAAWHDYRTETQLKWVDDDQS